MSFQEKFKETVSKGLEQSKHILISAKDKAKDLGDSGILRLEIRQLEDKVKKRELILGHTVYDLIAVEGKQSVTAKTAGVKEILDTLEDLHTQITAKRIVLSDLEEKEKGESGGKSNSKPSPKSSKEGGGKGKKDSPKTAEAASGEEAGKK